MTSGIGPLVLANQFINSCSELSLTRFKFGMLMSQTYFQKSVCHLSEKVSFLSNFSVAQLSLSAIDWI
jgi:hypothetical protein